LKQLDLEYISHQLQMDLPMCIPTNFASSLDGQITENDKIEVFKIIKIDPSHYIELVAAQRAITERKLNDNELTEDPVVDKMKAF